MSNENNFLKVAESLTMGKLYTIASAMMKAEETTIELVKSYTSLTKSDGLLSLYLLQKAQIARMGREIDEAIRNHEIQCHECGEIHKLRSVRIRGAVEEPAIICPVGSFTHGVILDKVEAKSLERILRFTQANVKDIFDTKVP